MNYQEALDWIMSFWEAGRPKEQEKALRVLKVPRMRALLERIGSPHLKYPSILIAGTKGKGSTAAFLAEGLRAAGYRVGRYTQPHLIDWRERTWVDGRLIEPEEVAALADRIRPAADHIQRCMDDLGGLTTYEIGTALTLAYFAEREIEIAVLEVGIGGRFDALNAVEPIISVVTSISYDHTDVLGETLTEIASEKAGVFRQGRRAVSAPQLPEAEKALQQKALERGTYLYFAGKDWRWRDGVEPGTTDIIGPDGAVSGVRIPLMGDHQRDNAALAAAALQLLAREGFSRIDADSIRRGLAAVEWPGRIEVIRKQPMVVVDAAHNEDSARRLIATLERELRYERLILVFGASGDKHIPEMARALGPAAACVIVTSSGHRRAADVESLSVEFARYTDVRLEPDPEAALDRAMEMVTPRDLVLVTGSVFLAGKALQLLKIRTNEDDRQ